MTTKKLSNFKLEFTLKQHTPIIHFQADQTGATLRVTELKPKLDRFIKNELQAIDVKLYEKFKDTIDDENIFPDDKGSNKYRLTLYATTKIPEQNTGAYFGDINDKIQLITSAIPIRVQIKSTNSRLNELIKEALRYVLVYENFGTRQTKGYGSFTPNNMNEDEFKEKLLKKYKVLYKKNSRNSLQTIKNDYQLLKSGRNRPYTKSILFDYLCGNKIKWEKRMIKEYLKRNHLEVFNRLKYETDNHRIKKCEPEHNNYEYKYIRGLLGIGEQLQFLKNNAPNNDKVTIKIKPKNSNIERFASPILYKVFDNKIYVMAKNNISIKGEEFYFELNGTILNKEIAIPENFNLEDFLNFALNGQNNYENNLSYQKEELS